MCRYIIYVDAFNLQKAAIKILPFNPWEIYCTFIVYFLSLLKCMLLPAFFSPVLFNTSFSSHCFSYICLERMRDVIQIQMFLDYL